MKVATDAAGMRIGLVSKTPQSIKLNAEEREINAILAERSVEIKPADMLLQQVVITTWFTQKKDPQLLRQNESVVSFEYIAAWYKSVEQLDLNAIIFFDSLPGAFIEQYSTDKIQFRKYISGEYSIYEERWMAGYLFLKKTKVPAVFFTDISDVVIRMNPFTLDLSGDVLYIGRDDSTRLWHSKWMLREIKNYSKDAKLNFPRNFIYMPMYNAGILGGNCNVLLHLLGCIVILTGKTKTANHKDMTLFNYVIYAERNPPLKASLKEPAVTAPHHDDARNNIIFSGYPLHSAFRKYENRMDVFFSHK